MGVKGGERREGERVGEDEHKDKNFYLNKKNNATALECSMRLHWNVQCDCIGMFNAIT